MMGKILGKTLRTLLLAFGLLSLSQTAAFAEFTKSQKEELNALIEAYVRENPEIVREALINLATKEAEAQRAQAFVLLADDEGDPYIGADNPDITIYEFSDYNCGYCKRVFAQLQAIVAEDPKVRLTLKEYPILAESSLVAARAAIASQKQDLFEPFHVGLMTWRGAITTDSILSIAAEVGLDLDMLEADMKSGKTDMILSRTRAAAQALEVSGTPALVIGTEFIGGAVSADEIRQVIAEQRALKNS